MKCAREPLPIDSHLGDILKALKSAGCVVIVAPPGAGKTTRVPPAILEGGLLGTEHRNLVMLQPRRVAARAAAQRVADECGWELGDKVGYQVRMEKRIGPHTRLRVITEGILARQLLDDPSLPGIGAVVLDEFHERSLHTDLAIAMLREVRKSLRPDLMLVVMSATLDAEPIAQFLGNCPIVRTEGRLFEVQIIHAGPGAGVARLSLPERVAEKVREVLNSPRSQTGDILVFLPGAGEINLCARLLESSARQQDVALHMLHGSLPFAQQMLALNPAAQRKIILSTNIAETSLTIAGVRTVIDSGWARQAGYDPRRGLDRLSLVRISRASATQRAGRAGRTAPGICVRLWTAAEEREFADFDLPEVFRVDLCAAALALHAWGERDPRQFGWFEAPPPHMLDAAERLLHMLGAVSEVQAGQITPMGQRLLEIPVHPRLGRLLIAAHDLEIAQGPAIAALLSERDIMLRTPIQRGQIGQDATTGRSDLLARLELLLEAERRGFRQMDGVDSNSARQVCKVRDDLRGRSSYGNKAAEEDELLKLALWAYPDRVCRRAGMGNTAVMVGGSGVRLAAESVVRQGEFFIAVDARADERSTRGEALVTIASAVEVPWLIEMFPQEIKEVREAVFDSQRQRVLGRTVLYYRDLMLRQQSDGAVDADEAGQVLAEALRPIAGDMFRGDEKARALLARIAVLQKAMPEHPWPVFNDAALAEILTVAAMGKRSVEEIQQQPMVNLLTSALAYPLDRLLEEYAPQTIAVPSGNRIAVQYSDNQRPVLAVRLQELFGWCDTPRIAGGRLAVTLHLLGPNYRPVQITDDLRSFWANAYFQVRKDLRKRYPKHSWPDDPLTAVPQARGRRK